MRRYLSSMKTSPAGLAFIAAQEGTILHVYTDQVGVKTIGIGHAIKPGETFTTITQQQALDLLAKDVAIVEKAINESVTVTLTQNQFDACSSFSYNLGTGAFKGSTLLKLLNKGDDLGAADEFLKWVKGGGKVLPGLVNRRQAERELFLKDLSLLAGTPPETSPGGKIIDIVKTYVGCSLTTRRDDLAKLVARGIDDPEKVVGIATNCGTSALGVMKLAGVQHPLLDKAYVNGAAITWIRKIAMDLKALKKYDGKVKPKPGSLLRYNTLGKNDDHVEWLMGPIDSAGSADHAGGGRANNEIAEGTGNVLSSWGRPLVEWIDPDELGIDMAPEATKAPPMSVPVTPPDTELTPVEIPVSVKVSGVVPTKSGTSTFQTLWEFILMLFKAFFGGKKS